jgi:hypothetical protein
MKRGKPNTGDKSFASHQAVKSGDDEAARAAATLASPAASDALTLSERLRLSVGNLDWGLIGRILAIKFLVLAFGGIFYKVWQNQPFDSWLGWLDLWNRWDSVHYQSIAQQGYQTVGDERFSIVFFPLYPLLIRAVALLLRNYLVSAFIVSGVASLAAGLLLKRLARADEDEGIAQRAVWFLIIFPTSYFLHIGYTESLFLALVLGCFVAARRGHWYLAGALSLLAALCRVNGLILFPVLFVEAFQEYRATKRWRWEWLWMLGALLGFACYLGMNYYVTGNALTFMTYQREHFFKQLTAPWMGMRGAFDSMWRQPAEAHMIGFEEFFFATLGLISTIFCARLLRLSYTVWMLLNWFLFTGTTFMVSVPRYTLTLFPIYILFARLSRRPFWNEVITAWSLMFLALFAGLFASGHWAF